MKEAKEKITEEEQGSQELDIRDEGRQKKKKRSGMRVEIRERGRNHE